MTRSFVCIYWNSINNLRGLLSSKDGLCVGCRCLTRSTICLKNVCCSPVIFTSRNKSPIIFSCTIINKLHKVITSRESVFLSCITIKCQVHSTFLPCSWFRFCKRTCVWSFSRITRTTRTCVTSHLNTLVSSEYHRTRSIGVNRHQTITMTMRWCMIDT